MMTFFAGFLTSRFPELPSFSWWHVLCIGKVFKRFAQKLLPVFLNQLNATGEEVQA